MFYFDIFISISSTCWEKQTTFLVFTWWTVVLLANQLQKEKKVFWNTFTLHVDYNKILFQWDTAELKGNGVRPLQHYSAIRAKHSSLNIWTKKKEEKGSDFSDN